MGGITATERGQKSGDVLLAGLVEPSDALVGELGEVSGQISPVGGQGVAGESALDSKVVEKGLHRAKEFTRRLGSG